MSKIEELIAASKLSDLVGKKEEKTNKTLLWVLAIVGAIAAIAAIAYAVYYYFIPVEEEYEDDLEDFDDAIFQEEEAAEKSEE
ncbi:MAG: DUF4366 domain-containing protein [Lachnospiraceae bacterium]|jgi:uncharacterized membrane protein|nr:DUF4366 domain-containing protein [Lachnospiraceae bacterium]